MANVLDQKLYHYLTQLNDAEKKSVLLLLKTFLASRKKTYEPVSVEQYNKEIDEALVEVEAGKYISQDELEKQAAKW